MTFSASYAAHVKTIDQKQTFRDDHPRRYESKDGRFEFLSRTMKLTSILLLIACLQVNATGFGQGTVTISLKNVAVTEVFKEIEKQTPFRFLYRDELVKKAGLVTISVRDASVQDVLNRCFDKKPLDYKIFKETIVISEKAAAVSNVGTGMIEEAVNTIDVTGRVLNEQGKPVEGVTVTIKNSDKSTITNTNGEFFLSSVEQDAVLVFTSVNMETFELRVSGKTELVVSLKAKVSELGGVEVVVNTGYERVPKERATGSFTFVTEERLNQRVNFDILSKLEGVSNGLIFNKSTTGENKIRIRGESTLFANPDPLIIVDNFPYDGNINNINPNDVESVTILKDASAASIWGVQAGNGVIVITTKRGKSNRPLRVEFNANMTLTEKPDLFYAKRISPADYIELEKYLFTQGYYDAKLGDPAMPAVSPVVEILDKESRGIISSSEANNQINSLLQSDIRNELLNNVYRNKVHQQHSMNLSGGSQNVNYFFSAGYDDDLAQLKGNNSERITLNSQNLFKPLKNLELTLGLNIIQSRQKNTGTSQINGIYPYTRLIDEAGNQLAVPQHRADFEDTITNHGFPDWKYYPLSERDLNEAKSKQLDTRVLAGIKYTLVHGLSVEFLYQYQSLNSQSRNLIDKESYTIRNRINTFSIINPDGNYVGSNFPSGGMFQIANTDLSSNSGRITLNYSRNWTNHSINALAGFEAREVETENTASNLLGYNKENGAFVVPDLNTFYTTFPAGFSQTLGGYEALGLLHGGTLNRFRSYFGNVGYAYKGRYTISLSGRMDGSNYFGVKTNKKTVPLWSAGLKWVLSSERFYRLNAIPNLSIRATYGFNGNLARNIAALTTMEFQGNTANTGLPFAVINNIPNPQLRWEKTAHFNIGLDFAINRNIISGSLEFYTKKGNDLIGDAPIDPTTGATQIRGNFAAMKSQGVDVQIRSMNFNRSFKWNTTLILNYASEKITRYEVAGAENSKLISYYSIVPIVGKPVYSLFSYRWAGLDQTNGDPLGYLGDSMTKNYADFQNKLREGDLLYSGRYNPSVFGSIINDFGFYGFNLTVNITYKFGHYFRRSSIFYNNYEMWQNLTSDYALRWQKPGDENMTTIPSLVYPANPSRDIFYNQSSILVERADHIRLQYVTLGYSLQGKILRSLKVQGVNLYINAQNLGILWRSNDSNIDPDYPYLGFPPSRSWSFGLNVKF